MLSRKAFFYVYQYSNLPTFMTTMNQVGQGGWIPFITPFGTIYINSNNVGSGSGVLASNYNTYVPSDWNSSVQNFWNEYYTLVPQQ